MGCDGLRVPNVPVSTPFFMDDTVGANTATREREESDSGT